MRRLAFALALAVFALGYAGAYALGTLLYFEPAPVSVLWTPSGVIIAALALTPRTRWPWIFAAQIVVHMALAGAQEGVAFALGATLADVLEPLVVFELLRRWGEARVRPTRLRPLLRFVLACMGGAAVAAAIGAATVVTTSPARDLFTIWHRWFFADWLGAVVVGGAIVAVAPWLRRPEPISLPRFVEGAVIFVFAALCVWLGASTPWSPRVGALNQPLIVLPVLAWSALRLHPRATAVLVAGVLYGWVGSSDLGSGAFVVPGRPLEEVVLALQVFAAGLCGVGLVLSAGLHEQRAEAEERRRREEELRITLQSIGDGVIATDRAGRVVLLNPVAEALTGWTTAQGRGRQISEVFRIVDAEQRAPAETPVERVMRTGKVVGLANHTTLIARDGVEHQIADSGAPIRDAQGDIVGAVLVFRDVTDTYRMQQQLQQAQKMEALGQLAGGVAHDFNNLIAAVMGSAELLGMSEALTSEEDRELVDSILTAAVRARELTGSLTSFARQEDPGSAPYAIDDCLREAVGVLARTLGRRVELELHCDSGGAMVSGNRTQLYSAIFNLAFNARDAMPEGGRISIECRRLGAGARLPPSTTSDLGASRCVHIRIEDTGCGMPAEVVARVFEPFFTTKAPGKGTGLGLAMVYGCVKQHGGEITVDSEEGRGTVFEIFLPIVEGEAAFDPRFGDDAARVTRGAPAAGAVLVIDDDEMVRHIDQRMLEELGYEVLEAPDAVEGLQLFEAHHERLRAVLLDMVMPGMPGDACAEALKAIDPNVPVIVCSGYLRGVSQERLREVGVARVLKKPYQQADLAEALRAVNGGGEPADQA